MRSDQESPIDGAESKPAFARLDGDSPNGDCVVKIGGDWRLSRPVPSWASIFASQAASNVHVVPAELGAWDTSLLLFLVHGRAQCLKSKRVFHTQDLPKNLQTLLSQVVAVAPPKTANLEAAKSKRGRAAAFARVLLCKAEQNISFVGECTLGFFRAVRSPRQFRWLDCLIEMQQCWLSSLPIASLVSFLVGIILAFQAAIQLKQFGASIYVADLVGLAVVREMGPMMAAVIVAGGTGAGFAAQLGNMKVDDEIDALETIGISAIDFLALPRMVAVTLMMPVIAVYANVVGILGGMFVSATMLDIPTVAYWTETQNRIGPGDVISGLIKSVFFGLLVGLAGCLRGMKCSGSAAGVGTATSSAVVTGILLIVVSDALFALIFKVVDI